MLYLLKQNTSHKNRPEFSRPLLTISPKFWPTGNSSRYKACLKLWKEGEELDDAVEEVVRHRRLILGVAAARETESGSHRIVNVDHVVGQGPRGGSLYQFQILWSS